MITKLLDFKTTPLETNETYVSAWHNVDWANTCAAFALADQAGTLYIEFSNDSNTVYAGIRAVVSANVENFINSPAYFPYIRVRYVNGATTQTSFRLTLVAGHSIH